MSEIAQWLAQVSRELDLPDEVADGVTGPVLDLVRDVAHGVNRPSGPLTAYLVGVAAGAAAASAAGAAGTGAGQPDARTVVERTVADVARVQGLVAAHEAAQDAGHAAGRDPAAG